MKHEHLVSILLENPAGVIDAIGRVAKLAGYDHGLVVGVRWFDFDHAANRTRSPRENLTGNAIEAGHIHDAGEEDDIFDTDVLRRVATGERGDHHLRKPNGQ